MKRKPFTLRSPLSVALLLCAALLCAPLLAQAQTPPKPKPKRNQSRNRKARTRNNRAGKEKDTSLKSLCPEDLPGTCPGTFSLVYTFTARARPRQGDNPTDLRGLGLAFNVYVTPRLFLELDQDHVLSQRAAEQVRATGVGDTTLIVGGDVLLEKPRSPRPGLALLYGLKLPTASARTELGSGHVDHQVALNLHKTFAHDYLEFDAGLILARTPNSENMRVATLGAGVLSGLVQHSLNARHLLHFQLDATLPGHGYKGDLAALSFWQVRLNERIALRVGALTGLTSNTPRVGAYVALQWEDNLRRWRRR